MNLNFPIEHPPSRLQRQRTQPILILRQTTIRLRNLTRLDQMDHQCDHRTTVLPTRKRNRPMLIQTAIVPQRRYRQHIFDFLTLDKDYNERDLERGLIEHITQFLLEMGAGFAYLG